jgi:hypothetical protein
MSTGPDDRAGAADARPVSKKEQILTLYRAGITEVADLAALTQTRLSYVASVLHGAEKLPSYFDLYTSTRQPMNAYSKFFAGKLGYRDEKAAQESVGLLDHLHRQFELAGDRAGQHHALLLALTMFDRARWTGKAAEAEVFRRWLKKRLDDPAPAAPAAAPEGPGGKAVTPAKPRGKK